MDDLEKQLRAILENHSIDDVYDTLLRIDNPDLGNCPECNGTGVTFGAPRPCLYCSGTKNVSWVGATVVLPPKPND